VTATVFKTVGRRFTPPPVGSTPTRFRHIYLDLSCMGLVITHSRIFTFAFMAGWMNRIGTSAISAGN